MRRSGYELDLSITMRSGGLAAVYFALWMPTFAGKSGPDLRMEFVSEVEAIRPGEPFTVGLHLEHGPGWHTYWQNPGIVGVPTSLDWNLPQGFVAGQFNGRRRSSCRWRR